MRRRTLLVGAVGLVGGISVRPALANVPDNLERALLTGEADSVAPEAGLSLPRVVDEIQRSVTAARRTFNDARYGELIDSLPGLISGGNRFQDRFAGQPSYADAMAELYLLTSALMIKVGRDRLAETSALKASHWAAINGKPATMAKASRARAIVLRRVGRVEEAQRVLYAAAGDIRPLLNSEPELRSVYGSSLATAAYTAAVGGDHDLAQELIVEADGITAESQPDPSDSLATFSASSLALYRLSVAQVAHDFSGVQAAARKVDLSVVPHKERRARYWVDLAKAFHQEGHSELCYRALLLAEQISPDETLFRKPVHVMTASLLSSPGELPGIRAFATRTGGSF